MKAPHGDKIVVFVALIMIVVGGAVTLFHLHPWPSDNLEIILPQSNAADTDTVWVYVGGGVVGAGWYPCKGNDSISDMISLAGGYAADADSGTIKLYVQTAGESDQPQLISVNRADSWLIQSLPGIGPSMAQRIIDYREANGPYVTIYELMLVTGIGEATFEKIRDFVTVE